MARLLTAGREDMAEYSLYDIKTTQSIQIQTARKGDNTGVLELVA